MSELIHAHRLKARRFSASLGEYCIPLIEEHYVPNCRTFWEFPDGTVEADCNALDERGHPYVVDLMSGGIGTEILRGKGRAIPCEKGGSRGGFPEMTPEMIERARELGQGT